MIHDKTKIMNKTECSLNVHVHMCAPQCRGKILLKVMRYNIELLRKKVTNYVT